MRLDRTALLELMKWQTDVDLILAPVPIPTFYLSNGGALPVLDLWLCRYLCERLKKTDREIVATPSVANAVLVFRIIGVTRTDCPSRSSGEMFFGRQAITCGRLKYLTRKSKDTYR